MFLFFFKKSTPSDVAEKARRVPMFTSSVILSKGSTAATVAATRPKRMVDPVGIPALFRLFRFFGSRPSLLIE